MIFDRFPLCRCQVNMGSKVHIAQKKNPNLNSSEASFGVPWHRRTLRSAPRWKPEVGQEKAERNSYTRVIHMHGFQGMVLKMVSIPFLRRSPAPFHVIHTSLPPPRSHARKEKAVRKRLLNDLPIMGQGCQTPPQAKGRRIGANGSMQPLCVPNMS